MLSREHMHSYQNRMSQFIVNNPFCAVWADMGLGKTVAAQTAYVDLRRRRLAHRALVVAPLRVANRVWTEETEQWAHLSKLKIERITGHRDNRMAALRTDAHIHTINRENLCWLESLFIKEKAYGGYKQIREWPWDTVILDESQSFKAQNTDRWKTMRRLRRLCDRMIQLTGSPMPNGYKDLWAQMYLLDRGERLGSTETAYNERWFDPPGYDQYRWTIKEGAAEQIQERIADIVTVMRAEDYLDLPPVIYNPVRVRLSPSEMEVYRKFERSSLLPLARGGVVTAANAGVLMSKLLQYANGAVYYDDKQNFEVVHEAKILPLFEVLDGLSGPTLIAYSFKSDLYRLKSAMERYCAKHSRRPLEDNRNKPAKTFTVLQSDSSFDAWRAGLVDYGILHPASAGHGLNDMHISGGENIVWFGPTNNLEFFEQLNARLAGGHRRMGKSVVVHQIIADGTVDEDMVSLLSRKGANQEDLKLALVERARRALQ